MIANWHCVRTLSTDYVRVNVKVCEEDGARVYSQITVQKSYMKDQQSDQDELQRVLNLRKVKSETEWVSTYFP